MLDAGMDAHDWPGGDEDDDGASPAAFLGVEFIPVEDLH